MGTDENPLLHFHHIKITETCQKCLTVWIRLGCAPKHNFCC